MLTILDAYENTLRHTTPHHTVVASPPSPFVDLLGGQAPEEKTDGPSVIVGKGKLGTALAGMGMGDDVMLGRGEVIPETIPGARGEGEL